MTERLSALLHEEADVLQVPPPTADRILADGRRIRRRHRVTYGAAGLALAGVLGTGIGLAVSAGDDDPANVVDRTRQGAALHGATFTVASPRSSTAEP